VSTVAITMAGRGVRFRDAGYDVPKYAIEVCGRTLFRWAVASLRSWTEAGARFVFLTRAEDAAESFIARECAAEGIAAFEVVPVEGITDGQATTALLAEPAVADASAPLAVYNIDTHVRPGAMRAGDAAGDGWIPCFPGAGDAWSFAAAGGDGRVTEVREKVRISPHATVGLYWFASFERYAALYRSHFAAGGEERGERYIAPMYNTLIAEGGEVRIAELPADAVVPLGTPDEVDRFRATNASRPAAGAGS
jgi:dTDP-glucose pyrophosphorylase